MPKEELLKYLRQGLTREKIAEIFHCSVDTIRRRVKEYGFENLPPEDYFFEEDTANCGMKEECNYNYHSLSHSDSLSDSNLQEVEEENEDDDFIRRKKLGF